MINKLTALVNEALRRRASTVIALALLLTLGKAYIVWDAGIGDWQGFAAQLFLTLIISFVVSIALHVIIYAIGPKKKAEEVAVQQAPVMTKDEHEAAIKAVNKELEAVKKADAAAATTSGTAPAKEEAPQKPINLAKELGLPKRAMKKSAARKSAPKKKAAKKKK